MRTRETAATQSAQAKREALLAPRTHWALSAHIAVSNGKDGGSGELEWRQDGDRFEFVVHAPVTGKTWKLSGDARRAVLEGLETQPLEGSDAERLLRDRLGWHVPLGELTAWIRGMRASGESAMIDYDEQARPALLAQAGWKVEYRDWFSDSDPPLPRKVFASQGQYRVRVAIQHWDSQ
jgi:outer membrane lipoprotein LolB